MDVPVKKAQDNGQKTSIDADILSRRLKNRERQRRYRERKRLKADTMKVLGTNQLASLPVEVPVNVAPLDSSMPVNVAPRAYVMPVDVASVECVMPVCSAPRDSVTRVYSGRNWKRDARKAHAVRQKEVGTNNTVSPSLPHVEQSDVALSNVISSHVSETNGTPKSIPSRRNWKAEARNKKS